MDSFKDTNQQILNEDEAAFYDRQIRLWGLDAQKRLRASKVLVSGIFGMGAEICKNIILSGVKSVTLLDHRNISLTDIDCNFLINPSMLDKNIATSSLENAQELNPNVEVIADEQNIEGLEEDYFKQFDLVCITRCSREHIIRINTICRKLSISFFAGDVYGLFGYSFTDLMDHKYVEEVKETKTIVEKDGTETKSEEVKMVEKTECFVPFASAMDIDWQSQKYSQRLKRTSPMFFILQVMQEFEFLYKRRPQYATREEDAFEMLTIRNGLLGKIGIPTAKVEGIYLGEVFAEQPSLCSIVGGVLSQEMIKAISQKDAPLNNFLFVSNEDCVGVVERLGY